MKTRSLAAVALLACVASASWVWAADKASDREIVILEELLREAKKDRVPAAERAAEAQQAAYESGTVTLDQAPRRLSGSEDRALAAATTDAERLEAFQKCVESLRQTEQKIEALYRTGSRGGEANAYAVIMCERQTAEIELLEEKLRIARAKQ